MRLELARSSRDSIVLTILAREDYAADFAGANRP